MAHRKTFLGVGWKFPPAFDKSMGSVMLVSEEEDIKESLYILLSTRPGERVMEPSYGCDLNFAAFENINATIIGQIKRAVSFAILYYEPRILVDEIVVEQNPENDGRININIEYTVQKTNNRSNMVYPYYLIEGTEVPDKYK